MLSRILNDAVVDFYECFRVEHRAHRRIVVVRDFWDLKLGIDRYLNGNKNKI